MLNKKIRKGEEDGNDYMPLPGQAVSIIYEARLENGTIVDLSSTHQKDGEPFSFVVGMGNVIDGWDVGIMSMFIGEKCDLVIQAKYAFGDEGRLPKIAPGATVIFNVELIQVGQRYAKQ